MWLQLKNLTKQEPYEQYLRQEIQILKEQTKLNKRSSAIQFKRTQPKNFQLNRTKVSPKSTWEKEHGQSFGTFLNLDYWLLKSERITLDLDVDELDQLDDIMDENGEPEEIDNEGEENTYDDSAHISSENEMSTEDHLEENNDEVIYKDTLNPFKGINVVQYLYQCLHGSYNHIVVLWGNFGCLSTVFDIEFVFLSYFFKLKPTKNNTSY